MEWTRRPTAGIKPGNTILLIGHARPWTTRGRHGLAGVADKQSKAGDANTTLHAMKADGASCGFSRHAEPPAQEAAAQQAQQAVCVACQRKEVCRVARQLEEAALVVEQAGQAHLQRAQGRRAEAGVSKQLAAPVCTLGPSSQWPPIAALQTGRAAALGRSPGVGMHRQARHARHALGQPPPEGVRHDRPGPAPWPPPHPPRAHKRHRAGEFPAVAHDLSPQTPHPHTHTQTCSNKKTPSTPATPAGLPGSWTQTQ